MHVLDECDLQVFLEPFSRVLGQAKTKQVLITVAQSDHKHTNHLHRLGILLGITDWVKDYQKKLNPQPSQDCYTHTAPVEHAMVRTPLLIIITLVVYTQHLLHGGREGNSITSI